MTLSFYSYTASIICMGFQIGLQEIPCCRHGTPLVGTIIYHGGEAYNCWALVEGHSFIKGKCVYKNCIIRSFICKFIAYYKKPNIF